MNEQLTLRIVLEHPPAGVDFGLQKGRGAVYETVQTQRSSAEMQFEFSVQVKKHSDGSPNFLGPFTHGPPSERFVYLDIGAAAGQTGTHWSRRLKIPLKGITWELTDRVLSSERILEARVPGTGRDGGPTCGTVKNFAGWKVPSK